MVSVGLDLRSLLIYVANERHWHDGQGFGSCASIHLNTSLGLAPGLWSRNFNICWRRQDSLVMSSGLSWSHLYFIIKCEYSKCQLSVLRDERWWFLCTGQFNLQLKLNNTGCFKQPVGYGVGSEERKRLWLSWLGLSGCSRRGLALARFARFANHRLAHRLSPPPSMLRIARCSPSPSGGFYDYF